MKTQGFHSSCDISLPSATYTWKYAEIPMHKLDKDEIPNPLFNLLLYKNLMGRN